MKTKRIILIVLIVLFSVLVVIAPGRAASDMTVYANSLSSGWQDGSWGAAINFSNTSPVHGGPASIAATINSTQWGGLYLMSGAALDSNGYTGVSFWIHGGPTGGQQINFKIIDGNDGNWDTAVSVTPVANTWTQVTVNLAQVANPATIGGLVWQDSTGGSQPIFYVDDIVLIGYNGPTPTSPAPGQGPALSVNAAAGQHPISPDIYGMNYASETIAADLNLPVRRWGGNSTSRYNWQNSFTNTGSDWYYENVPGNYADNFVDQDRRTETKTILTMPLIGWVSKNSPTSHPFDCGFKISKYGNQEDADWEWDADCGNGNYTNGAPITGNDPLDTSIAITSSYATGWVNHLTSTFGTAANGGVQFYNLDNEPMLWNSTHRDVHPNPTTYDEMRDKTWAYAAAIKAADPGAKTLGPVVWGWCAYFYSAADGCSPGPDHQSHGNVDFVEWYLQQMQAYEQQHGVRILDYVDVHIYPQIDGLYSKNLGTAAVQAARLRSTRQLWDTTYVHEGWIGQPVYLIPRMKQWVANNYPATKLAITEYNWGALGYMNGALAQADLLGIFGREGLDLATLWGPPTSNQPGAYAFRMYLNYDGNHSAFGDTSVQSLSANQGDLAIYAALRSGDGALTLMIINKTSLALTSQVSLAGFSPSNTAAVYRYSAANLTAIIHENNQAVTASGFSATFPGNSITLVIIPRSSGFPASFGKSAPENEAVVLPSNLNLSWESSSGATSYEYCYDTSNDNACTNWTSNGTSTSKALSSLITNATYYWHVRAVNSSGITYANGSSTAFWSFSTDPNGSIPSTWIGGVSIASDQNVVAVARPHLGSEVASYIGSAAGATTQYVPMLFKGAFSGTYNAALYIQNVSATAATLNLEFTNSSGTVVYTKADTLDPHASKGYWLPTETGLPAGFAGGVKVTSTQPILAVGRPHIGTQVMTYNGMSSGATSAWLPMFFKNGFSGSYNTALYIQNVTGSSANLTIQYINLNGTVACTDNDTLGANASKGYWSLAITCDTGSLPSGFVGGVKVTSTQNILAVGRAHLGTQITTYNGSAAGASSAYVPMLFRNAFGGAYDAALYLQNVSGSSATVTIEYLDSAGAVAATQNVTLAANAISSIWLPTVVGLPDDFAGGARVTSTQDVIAIGRPHLGSEISAYNGAPAGSLNAYLPMLFKNAYGGGYDAAFYIQNTSGSAANVEISFYDSAGVLSCIKSIDLAAGATAGFWMPTVTCTP